MAWTTAQDVLDAWIGDDAPTDLALVDVWLSKAEREARFRVSDLQARIDAQAALIPPSTDLLDAAKDVIVAMVTRVFRNPEGIRQTSVGEGPFSESRTYGGNTPGGLAMTDDELEKLRGVLAAGRAFSIDMIPATSPFSPNYVSDWPWS